MAQSEVAPEGVGVIGGHVAAPTIARTQVQLGSSDKQTVRTGAHTVPFNSDYGNLGNSG
jgi:hypothetical protein